MQCLTHAGFSPAPVRVATKFFPIPWRVTRGSVTRALRGSLKRLRLPAEASGRDLDLDLRQANDLDRSRLLHRLLLLGVAWGAPVMTLHTPGHSRPTSARQGAVWGKWSRKYRRQRPRVRRVTPHSACTRFPFRVPVS